jgi:acetoin utilization protein AcuB
MVAPTIPAQEAQQIMAENKIRHLPVVGDGKRFLGLITRQRLSLEPDTLSSLGIWEISRHLSTLTAQKIMIPAKQVYTIEPNRTVEHAARYMSEYKIGCLPVIEEEIVVGLITETDLLNSYQEMLGLPVPGVRVTMRMPDRRGEFAKLMTVLGEQGWGVMGVGTYPSPRREGYYDAVLKIPKVALADVQETLSQIPGQEIIDIREVN